MIFWTLAANCTFDFKHKLIPPPIGYTGTSSVQNYITEFNFEVCFNISCSSVARVGYVLSNVLTPSFSFSTCQSKTLGPNDSLWPGQQLALQKSSYIVCHSNQVSVTAHIALFQHNENEEYICTSIQPSIHLFIHPVNSGSWLGWRLSEQSYGQKAG